MDAAPVVHVWQGRAPFGFVSGVAVWGNLVKGAALAGEADNLDFLTKDLEHPH